MLTLLTILLIIAACALVISFIILDNAVSAEDTWVGCLFSAGGWALVILVFILGKIFL